MASLLLPCLAYIHPFILIRGKVWTIDVRGIFVFSSFTTKVSLSELQRYIFAELEKEVLPVVLQKTGVGREDI